MWWEMGTPTWRMTSEWHKELTQPLPPGAEGFTTQEDQEMLSRIEKQLKRRFAIGSQVSEHSIVQDFMRQVGWGWTMKPGSPGFCPGENHSLELAIVAAPCWAVVGFSLPDSHPALSLSRNTPSTPSTRCCS